MLLGSAPCPAAKQSIGRGYYPARTSVDVPQKVVGVSRARGLALGDGRARAVVFASTKAWCESEPRCESERSAADAERPASLVAAPAGGEEKAIGAASATAPIATNLNKPNSPRVSR